MLTACALTGVDSKTDFGRVLSLTDQHPFVEWGLLFSRTRSGVEPRYMRPSEIVGFLDRVDASGRDVKLALHLCGRSVVEFLDGDVELRALAARFGRVQINFNAGLSPEITPERIDAALAGFPQPVITQHNDANAGISQAVRAVNHQLLVDASLGRGIRAETWPPPQFGKPTGYAGGIGPSTIDGDLERALLAADGADTWIDMEGQIRRDDWFDLDLCEKVLVSVSARLGLALQVG